MNDVATQLAVWLNVPANRMGEVLLAPIGWLPGPVSATIAAALSGIVMLLVLKHVSNQRALEAVRRDIAAQLLAIRLFSESVAVTVGAQGRLLWNALRLIGLLIIPTAVMALPFTLLLGQLGLWYQARPLCVGDEAVVTLKMRTAVDGRSRPDVALAPTSGVAITGGPVYIAEQRAVCWRVRALADGYQQCRFNLHDQEARKELAVGSGMMRVSLQRPGWDWLDVLLHPAEPPLPPSGAVESIEIQYPPRASWTSGTDGWLVYWFLAAMATALALRRAFGVHL